MTEYLKNKTIIPNWVMSIVFISGVSICGLGWKKIDSLEKQVIVNETRELYEREKLQKIERKIDEVLRRVRELEKQ